MSAEKNVNDVLTPVGYQILVRMPPPEDKTSGGIIIPDKAKEAESAATVLAQAVSIGPDAYKDTLRFPNGNYCRPDDWVVISKYAGVRLDVDGNEYRLINDDTVLAVVKDTSRVTRKA